MSRPILRARAPGRSAVASIGATRNAARVFPAFKGLGTLAAGAPADVTVLEARQGSFDFLDNVDGKRTGTTRLVATATFFAGKRARS